MKKFHFGVALALLFLAGCSGGGKLGGSLFPTSTPLPTAIARVTHAPDAAPVVTAFLESLKNGDYASMYALLDSASQAAITQDDFTARYRETLNTLSASTLDFEAGAAATGPAAAQVPFRVTYHSALAGDIARDMTARLVRESGGWRVQWDEGMILPELAGGNRLALDCKAPARGDIFDRNGEPLVSQMEAIALGVDTGNVNFDRLFDLTKELWQVTGVNPETLNNKIVASGPGWYIPVGTTSREEGARLLGMQFSGLVVNPYQTRYYHNSGIASQTIGYTLSISPENLDAYKRQGYCGNERVGWIGVEKAEESYLAGEHGGSLYVVNPQGQIVTDLAQKKEKPSSNVYLTLDKNLQLDAERALANFTGAVVVMERDSGRVLALASSPGFDPNLFDPQNYNNGELLPALLNNPDRPMYNRATQGQYPLGSVFKVITFSAGLESGLYLPETTYDCQYDFTELQDRTLHDWTWDHCQTRQRAGLFCNTSDSTPSGVITLQQGLMRSCNPYFWHIGLDLYNNNRSGDIAKMSRAFGLGSLTGIVGVEEEPGQILDPATELEAANQSIGQGDVLVTPLQVARFMAAIGNGGTLYRPQLIEKIVGPDGETLQTFKPDPKGTLPIQPDRLKALQEAMTWVVTNPRGTAYFRLTRNGNLTVPVAGKTGTAESNIPGLPHAWFAGYSYNNFNGKPDIAVAVISEYVGEGSDYAAPIFLYMIESYFYDRPLHTTTWFGPIGGPALFTPTPFGGIPTKTPRP
ncbi:MAG: penicillin-binding transpeptidase domain-containing protein [Anaerolineales bacterium]|nr:MAG: penicillin-binding transpeptidase domain-containing protein [Anaerolineales bacterium]